jgi:hypothetical protein
MPKYAIVGETMSPSRGFPTWGKGEIVFEEKNNAKAWRFSDDLRKHKHIRKTSLYKLQRIRRPH